MGVKTDNSLQFTDEEDIVHRGKKDQTHLDPV